MFKALAKLFFILTLACVLFVIISSYMIKTITVLNKASPKSFRIRNNQKTQSTTTLRNESKVLQDKKFQLAQDQNDDPSKDKTFHSLKTSPPSDKNFSFSSFSISSKNPLVETDQSRYILAIAHNGPTNQLLALREAIFLSIRMNRTLILPKFFKVSIDRSSKIREVPAEYRFDLSSLSKLVPFEFNNKSQEICENGLEVLLTRETCSFIYRRRNFVKKTTQRMNIAFPTNPSDGTAKYVCSDDKISYPFLSQDYSKYKCIGFAFYHTERRVSVRSVRSARSILDKYKLKGVKTSTTNLNDATLYALSFLSTGLPLLVKNLVKEFVNKHVTGNSWLAIHWRYNPDDWMAHCTRPKNIEKNYQEICSRLNAILPKDILYAGITALEQPATHTENDISTIYVATPLNQKTIIDGIEAEYLLIKKQEQRKRKRKNKKNNKAINVLTSVTLNNFLETQKYLINDNFYNDVIALVEMELCIESTLFLYSQRSSWSQNVLKERIEKKTAKLDQEIVSRAWKEHVRNKQ